MTLYRKYTGEKLPLAEKLTDRERALLIDWYEACGAIPPGANLYSLPAVMFDALCKDPEPYLAKAREWRRHELQTGNIRTLSI